MSQAMPVATPSTATSAERHLSGDDILNNARGLVNWLRARSEAIETARRLPADVVQKLREAGVFRMNMPRSWGGPEMTPMQQIEVIEEISRGDASAGWCTMIGADSGIYSAYLDETVARQMYPRLDMIQGGWVYPVGQAHRVSGGYEVTGTWMFGSGSNHCDWLAGGCVVYQGDKPAPGANGSPEWRIVIAKPSEYEILDTWYTTGLCGTGSNDYRCTRLFVPEERTFTFVEPAKRSGTLWRRPDTFLRKMAAIPLGVARDALDTATRIAGQKVEMPEGRRLRDLARVQAAIAEAEGIYGAARSYVFSSLERQWNKLERNEELTKRDRADVWLARTNAFQSARRVVEMMFDLVGGSAVYSRKSPLDRNLRDVQTMCQHICGQMKPLEGVGGMLLDSPLARPHPLM